MTLATSNLIPPVPVTPSPRATAQDVRLAHPHDERSLTAAMTLAFASDPAVRWLYPDAYQFFTSFPGFVKAFGGNALAYNTAFVAAPRATGLPNAIVGTALWLAPGVEPDSDGIAAYLQQSLLPASQANTFSLFEQMDQYHPHEPHWYLALLGVEPAYQRQGFGSALMQPILERCDRDGLPAYLESSNITNVVMYERHGFEVIGTIQAGNSPTIYPMYRQPGAPRRSAGKSILR